MTDVRKRVGPPTQLREVWRVAGGRGAGAPGLYAFGYADLAELLGESAWDIAAAVVDGHLDPLHLVELVIVRRRGLAALVSDLDRAHARTLLAGRPHRTREVARVRASESGCAYGLGDLWAVSHADISAQTGRGMQHIWNAQKLGRLLISDLVSVLDYALACMTEQRRAAYGLTD